MAETIEDLHYRKDPTGTIRCQCGKFELTVKQLEEAKSTDNLLIIHAKTHSATTVSMIDVN